MNEDITTKNYGHIHSDEYYKARHKARRARLRKKRMDAIVNKIARHYHVRPEEVASRLFCEVLFTLQNTGYLCLFIAFVFACIGAVGGSLMLCEKIGIFGRFY